MCSGELSSLGAPGDQKHGALFNSCSPKKKKNSFFTSPILDRINVNNPNVLIRNKNWITFKWTIIFPLKKH